MPPPKACDDSSGYCVSPYPIYGEDIKGQLYYLIKTDGKWTASRTGDTKDEGVEAVVVDASANWINLYAWRTPFGRGIEKPELAHLSSCLLRGHKRESGGNNMCVSEFSDVTFGRGAEINPKRLLEAAKSSGLIAMAEHDRQKAEQDRLAEDRLAEQGNADAKYQRGLFYLGSARYNAEAEKWFEKAATLGHADALYKLASFQNDFFKNKVEAERLFRKAAQAGSKEARIALDSIVAERKRIELQEKQMADMQAKKQKQIAEFRKSISVGDESNCGPVIEIKGKLVKVAFAVANYGNEHWVRRDEIYPFGWGCRFVNGQYQPPE